MRRRLISWLGLAVRLAPVAAVVALIGCATPKTGAPTPAPVEASGPPPYAYETFDAVWATIDERHFDRTHNGVDWTAVREEYRPKVAMVRNDQELRSLLSDMIGQLGQSHFGIIPRDITSPTAGATADATTDSARTGPAGPESANSTPSDDHADGDLGVLFRLVQGDIVTVAPRPGGAAERAGIQAGWVLVAINGTPVSVPARLDASGGSTMVRYLAEAKAAHRVSLGPGESAELTFDTLTGRTTASITADSGGGQLAQFGNLPPLETIVTDRAVTRTELDRAMVTGPPPSFAYIFFNIWMIPAAARLDAAVDRHRSADGLILDLRGNPGGVGAMAMGIGGHFVNEPLSLGKMINPQATLEFRVNPRRATSDGRVVAPYAGPFAILIDPLTASTSEIFAAGMQDLGRARVFGQISAGAALPSIAVKLPNGDVLQYAMADFVTPKGNRIEGHGVVPDVNVELTLDALRRDPDPVLTAAVRWLADEAARRNPTQATPTS